MDVFVLTSAQPEPFGGVVMEAMAWSGPSWRRISAVRSNKWRDGVTGFPRAAVDPEALADKLQIFLCATRHCGELGEAVAAGNADDSRLNAWP